MPKNDYITIAEASAKWNLSQRQVQHLCTLGSVEGATKFGRAWMIPRNANKPVDGRTKARRHDYDADMPLPRKTPFLYMSDLYNTPGTADTAAESLSYNHEAKVLFEAEVAYSRGEIDRVYDIANYLLGKHSGFYAILSAGMLLAMCAIWKGDINMWRRAKVHISEAPAKNDNDREVMQLAISAVDIMMYNVQSFPKWFQIGRFEPLHKDSYPAAKVYYAKFLYAVAYSVATGELKITGAEGLYVMTSVPYTIEPMICWASEQNTVMSEIYLRMTCAAVYHNYGNDNEATHHIDKALELALPDKLYGTIAEYCRILYALIERRLAPLDEKAWNEVKRLHRIYNEGWTKLNGSIKGQHIIAKLSDQNRVVARLAAFKLSDAEIAARTNMSLSGVKQAIKIIKEKSGLSRDEFAAIL